MLLNLNLLISMYYFTDEMDRKKDKSWIVILVPVKHYNICNSIHMYWPIFYLIECYAHK